MSKQQMNLDPFKQAEALGHIKTGIADPKPIVKKEEPSDVVDNPEIFRMRVGDAQLEGKDYIEVTEKLFNYMVKNSNTAYFTYGEPGIKVFKAGTRKQILKEESMNAENYGDMMIKRKVEARRLVQEQLDQEDINE